jgi:hypothetical protein
MAQFELNVKVNGIEQTVSTIGQLEKALADTNAQLQNVEENSKEFKFLTNQAQNLEKVMVGLTSDAKAFDSSLKGVNTSAKNLNSTFNQTAQAANSLDDAGQSVKNTSNTIKEATGSAASLRTELRQIVQELQTLEPGSARFQELSLRAGELRDQIADTSAVVNQLAGNFTERLTRGISGAVQIGVAGFQAVTAAQALFGAESEAINQTLVKLSALLNLSQALETFGGLDQKIVEIKAAFSSLFPAASAAATATTAAATATAAEGVAATGAAASTTAFGVALNALPLVAIVTALGLLVAGLIEYASGSDEAAKAEEERKKKLEEEKAAIDGVIDSQAKEGASLITLLSRLKATTAGTKERADLVKEINDNYGVGLQNLKDEEAFQNQVTESVKAYIAQLKNKVAAQLVEAQISELIKKQIQNQRELESVQKNITLGQSLYNSELNKQFGINQLNLNQQGIFADGILKQTQYVRDFQNAENLKNKQGLDGSIARQKQLKAENDAIQAQIENLGVEAQKYATLLQGAFEKTSETSKGTTKQLEDLQRKQDEVLQNLREFTDKANQAEIDLQRARVQRTTDRVDDLEFERDIVLSTIIQEYTTQKKAIEDNIKDEQKRKVALENLEINYQRLVTTQNLITSEKIEEINNERLKKQRDFYQELVLAERFLQEEITFGNNNTADTLAALDNRLLKIQIDRLDRELQSNQLSLQDYEAKQKERLLLLQQYNEEEKNINRKAADTERDFQISEIVKYYQSLGKYNVRFNEETQEYEVNANAEYLQELAKQDTDYLNTAEKESIKIQNVINKSAINLNEEANVKKSEADADYENKKKDNAEKTEDEILSYRIRKLEEYNKIFGDITGGILDLASALTEGFLIEEENRLNNLKASTLAQESTINESFNTQLAALQAQYQQGIITQEQYNTASQTLETNRVNGITALNKKLSAEQLKSQKEAFEKEKKLKIASAIIAGIQGAVSAFTGAFQLGPIAGPIVGGILAALVAATTAVQVNNIKKTQLDTTGSIEVTAPSSVGSGGSAGGSVVGSALASTGGFTSFTPQASGGGSGMAPNTGSATFTSAQRVYVLESDITSSQERVRVLEDNSTFG